MKLTTQISVLIVFGLAIHGLTRNGIELEQLYKNRCQCCGKPVIEPLEFTNAQQQSGTTNTGFSSNSGEQEQAPKKRLETSLPNAIAVKGPSATTPPEEVDPMVQDILNLRRQLGGSSIASILGPGLDSEDSEIEEALLFQQAVQGYTGYAGKVNYEQAVEESLPLSSNPVQGPPSQGPDRWLPENILLLCRFRF